MGLAGADTSRLLNNPEIPSPNKIPQDKWHLSYIIFLTLGLGYVLPWNAFITAVDYFSYLYPGASVDRIFAVANMFFIVVSLFIIILYSHRSNVYVQINVGLGLITLALLIVPIIDAVYIKGRVGLYDGFYVTVGAVALSGLGNALVQGGIVGSAGESPDGYMQATLAGTSASGIYFGWPCMTNWMRSMGLGGAGIALLSRPSMAALFSSAYQKPLSLTSLRTPFYLFSSLPRPHRTLSAPAASFSSVPSLNDNDNTFDFGDGEWTAVSRNGSKLLLKGMTYAELEKWVQSYGYRPGQAMMLWKRMYGNNIWAHHSDELEGLNKDFKKMLSENAEFRALSLKEIHAASDGTRKILFTLDDGLVIETVVIPCDRGRNTVCVSSQVGCAMNCQFCYTGRMGLTRHLTAAEIVEQAVFAQRLLTSEVGSITNVVFMGMGEPLHNIDNVIKAADIMVHEQGLHFSPRKVTVSTSGLVPQLRRFLHESNCALAVSLNATTDEVRNWIMPINRKYKLDLLLQTLREELCFKPNYKVLFEYVMLAGVNDSDEDAKRLIDLVKGIPCKINLISFNPHSGSLFRPTKEKRIIEFRNKLAEAGCTVFLRPSRGDDQMAACGQLGKPGAIQAPLLRVPQQFQMALGSSA